MNKYILLFSAMLFPIILNAHNTVVTHPKITESGLELLIKKDQERELKNRQYEEIYSLLNNKTDDIFVINDDDDIVLVPSAEAGIKNRPIYQFWGFNPRVADDTSNKAIDGDNFGCFDSSRTDATAASNLYPCLSSQLLKPFLNRTVSEGVVFEDHPLLRYTKTPKSYQMITQND